MPKQESDTTNTLRATMGLPFQCRVCGHRHQPASKAAMGCRRTLPWRAVPEAIVFSWGYVYEQYQRARSALRSRGQWMKANEKMWADFKPEAGVVPVPPDATDSELAAWDGGVRYRARYAVWEREHQAELARFRKAVESLAAQVERLVAGKSGRPRHRHQRDG